MITFADSPSLPVTVDRLLATLHASQLLSDQQTESLAEMEPNGTRDARSWAARLVQAGILTAYQAEQLLAGCVDRLVLGQYRILERLNAGGMGEVYRAEHLLMKRTVALKIIAPHLLRDASAVADFQREIQLAAMLSHPNIITTYDAAEANGVHFFVMEYVDGIDLGRLLRESGPLAVGLACEYTRQVALGLQHAHDCGLVHCDIKPANVLVRRSSSASASQSVSSWSDGGLDSPIVKILDFGLARLSTKPAENGAALRTPGPGAGHAGTPDYMAPEQARDFWMADSRSDLYSLGCTFYCLLTGQVPYPGGAWAEKLLRHRFDSATPITQLRPGVPAEVVAVVQRLMAKNPEERYANASELARTLQEWVSIRCHPFDSTPVVAVSLAVKTHFAGDGLTLPSSSLRAEEAAAQVRPHSNGDTPGPGKKPVTADGPCAGAWRERPRHLSRHWPIAASIAVGLLSAWMIRPFARVTPESSPPSLPDAPEVSAFFRLSSMPQETFSRLQEALAAAKDNDIILIHGNGPFLTPPLRIDGKALTIKAEPGFRPKIELAPRSTVQGWQPLLATNRPLLLEGLDLSRQVVGNRWANPDTAHLVYCEQASLRMVDCCLDAPRGRALLVCRDARAVELRDCQITAHASAVCVEVGSESDPEIRLSGNHVMIRDPGGAALSLWAADLAQGTAARLHLAGNTIEAGRIVSLTQLCQGVEVVAQGNTFRFTEALFSCAGLAGKRGMREAMRWQGQDNCYRASGDWLSVDGVPAGVRGLASWREFWHAPEPGSHEESAAQPHHTAFLGPTH